MQTQNKNKTCPRTCLSTSSTTLVWQRQHDLLLQSRGMISGPRGSPRAWCRREYLREYKMSQSSRSQSATKRRGTLSSEQLRLTWDMHWGHAEIIRMLLEAGAKSDLRIGSDQIFGAVLAEGVDVRGGSHRGRGGRGWVVVVAAAGKATTSTSTLRRSWPRRLH